MNKKEYIQFLEKKKKSRRAINSYTDYVQQYEAYLFDHKKGKRIENAGKKDLHDFEKWGEKNNLKINRYLWGIKEYYDFISKKELELEANAMIGERYFSQFKLKDFVGVKQGYIKKLAKEGFKTAKEMLYAGFKGIPPTPGEAQDTVTMAKYIKRLVEY